MRPCSGVNFRPRRGLHNEFGNFSKTPFALHPLHPPQAHPLHLLHLLLLLPATQHFRPSPVSASPAAPADQGCISLWPRAATAHQPRIRLAPREGPFAGPLPAPGSDTAAANRAYKALLQHTRQASRCRRTSSPFPLAPLLSFPFSFSFSFSFAHSAVQIPSNWIASHLRMRGGPARFDTEWAA